MWYFLRIRRRRFAGAERGSRPSQSSLHPFCLRVRAAEHAPRGPCRLLERRQGLAEIVECGTVVPAERLRVCPSYNAERRRLSNTNTSRRLAWRRAKKKKKSTPRRPRRTHKPTLQPTHRPTTAIYREQSPPPSSYYQLSTVSVHISTYLGTYLGIRAARRVDKNGSYPRAPRRAVPPRRRYTREHDGRRGSVARPRRAGDGDAVPRSLNGVLLIRGKAPHKAVG